MGHSRATPSWRVHRDVESLMRTMPLLALKRSKAKVASMSAARESRRCIPADPLVNSSETCLAWCPGSFYGSPVAQHRVRHQEPHTACRTDMWGRLKFINKISLIIKMAPPPLPPINLLDSAHNSTSRAGALPYWIHCVLLGSLLTTVAVQPGRCVASEGHCFLH
jgi:hypothetical protein